MLTIKPVSESVPARTLQSSQDPPGKIFQTMSPGRVLHIEVVRGGEGNALLRWGNFEFQAESQVPLREGQKLNLLVTENSSQIKLKILGNNSQTLRNFWPLIAETNLLSRLLEAVMTQPQLLSKPLSHETEKSLDLFRALEKSDNLDLKGIEQFLRLLGMKLPSGDNRKGGVSQEKDLRSCLQELLAGLKDPGSDLGKRLEAVLEGLGKNSPAGQEGKEAETGFTFLPLPFLEKGFLVFQRSGEEGRAEDVPPWRLSLFLETQSLGELQVDFMEHDNGLLLKFISEFGDVKAFLESCRDDFKNMFSALPLRSLTFETAVVPPGNYLLKRIAVGEEGVLETYA